MSVTLAEATTIGEDSILAVNDMFIGLRSYNSVCYLLNRNSKKETQCSSGIIISTCLGSTGWCESLLAGAAGIAGRSPQTKLA